MMLKAQSGLGFTSLKVVPAGATQSLSCWPTGEPSSETRGMFNASAAFTASPVASSVKRIFTSASVSMPCSCSGVDPGASGATTTPARSAPRKMAA